MTSLNLTNLLPIGKQKDHSMTVLAYVSAFLSKAVFVCFVLFCFVFCFSLCVFFFFFFTMSRSHDHCMYTSTISDINFIVLLNFHFFFSEDFKDFAIPLVLTVFLFSIL